MADPVTLAVVGIGATVAGTGIKMFGEYAEGEAQANIDNYKAEVARQNARYEQLAGEQRQTISGIKTAQRVGGIRAAQGGSGISVETGTATDVVASQQKVGEFERRQIAADTARKAYGLTTEAGLLEYGAKQAKTAAGIKMAGTAVSGLASVAGKWSQASDLGMFDTGSESQVTASDPFGLGRDFDYGFGVG